MRGFTAAKFLLEDNFVIICYCNKSVNGKVLCKILQN